MLVDENSNLSTRASIYAALADPGRVAIADRLLCNDASPSELQRLLSMPSNLVAHHVRVLENAGVVRRVRSGGDHRRCYLRINAEVFETIVPNPGQVAQRVLFVGTENSVRSQLAAAMWNRHGTTRVPAASAGTHPVPEISGDVLSVVRRRNIAVEPRHPRHLDDVQSEGDLIIAVCDRAHEDLPRSLARMHWSLPDPHRNSPPDVIDAIVDQLAERIDYFGPRVQPA